MPTSKDFKRLVRRRMQKTGESYTTARIQIARTKPAPQKTIPAKPDYAKLAGMSDAAVEAATGRTWTRWVKVLDSVNAREWPHGKIAIHVHEKFGVKDWWAQAVTVGYERIRGLREIGQRRSGTYEATKSRTFPVPVSVLFEAFTASGKRARWLPGIELVVRKATPNRSVRMSWKDGTSVEVWLVAKGEAKSSAQIQHRKLPTQESAARAKAFWTERLDSLAKFLTP